MGEPFIKIYNKMLSWEWYDDIKTFKVFMHCLLRAEWKAGSWHGVSYEAGQFITSLPNLAKETHLSIQEVRTALNHLISTGEITSNQQGNARIITVVKWSEYQGGNRLSNRPSTDHQQGSNRPSTACKEYKDIKEKEEVKDYKYYPNDVSLNKTFADYVGMRKQIKKPMTDKAIVLAIKKLDDLSGGNNDKAIQILEQSIMNSWQGLFPLKTETKSQGIDWSSV